MVGPFFMQKKYKFCFNLVLNLQKYYNTCIILTYLCRKTKIYLSFCKIITTFAFQNDNIHILNKL